MVGATWPPVAPSAMPTAPHDCPIGLSSKSAATTMPKVNSETNLAVQLLAALRAAPPSSVQVALPSINPARPHDGAKQRPRTRITTLAVKDDCGADQMQSSVMRNETSTTPASEVSTDEDLDDDGTDSSGSRAPLHSRLQFGVDAKSNENKHSLVDHDNRDLECVDQKSIELPQRVIMPSSLDSDSAVLKSNTRPSSTINHDTLYKYTREERRDALRRFKEKKRLRTFKKTIRYDIRKRLADTRPRYKGRFSKPPPGESYDVNPGDSPQDSTSKA